MLAMTLTFGDPMKDREEIRINLDSYGAPHGTSADNREMIQAFELLHNTISDIQFMDPGERNEDAVNSLIALHVLGYDAKSWMEEFLDAMSSRFSEANRLAFMEHVARVAPYLEKWGPFGYEARALDFAI